MKDFEFLFLRCWNCHDFGVYPFVQFDKKPWPFKHIYILCMRQTSDYVENDCNTLLWFDESFNKWLAFNKTNSPFLELFVDYWNWRSLIWIQMDEYNWLHFGSTHPANSLTLHVFCPFLPLSSLDPEQKLYLHLIYYPWWFQWTFKKLMCQFFWIQIATSTTWRKNLYAIKFLFFTNKNSYTSIQCVCMYLRLRVVETDFKKKQLIYTTRISWSIL